MKLDYWMYLILEKILSDKLKEITKKYKPEGFEMFKENRFTDLGQVYLIRKKIKELHE